jgi:outer membrane receptor for ferrienterochelin and colicins
LSEGSRLKLWGSLGTFRDQFLLDQRDSGALDERQDTRERIGQLGAQLDLLLGSAHLGSIGSEVWYESLATERLVGGNGTRTRAALYAQDEWTLSEAPLWVLLPGARLDVDSQFGMHVTPRAALRFDPVSELTFRASYAWGFKAPDFRELYLLFENPSAGYLVEGSSELEPETSTHLSVGLEYRPARAVWLSLQGLWNELEDRISTDLVPTDEVGPQRFRYRNIDSARTLGAEASARVTPVLGLHFDLSYALAHTRDAASDQPISGQPLQRGTLSARYRAPGVGFEASSRAAIVGARAFFQDTDADGVSERRDSRAYASVDVRVSQVLGYGFRSFVLAENLLDAGDAEFLTLQPRTFSGGARFDY